MVSLFPVLISIVLGIACAHGLYKIIYSEFRYFLLLFLLFLLAYIFIDAFNPYAMSSGMGELRTIFFLAFIASLARTPQHG